MDISLDGEPNAATVLLKDVIFSRRLHPTSSRSAWVPGHSSRSFLLAEDFRFNDRRRCPVRTDRLIGFDARTDGAAIEGSLWNQGGS